MTPAERRAYDEGIKAAVDAAREAVITIETAQDAGTFRKRIVAEALAAFADAAEGLKHAVTKHSPHTVLHDIEVDPATTGQVTCPECAGRLKWTKAESNGHIHAHCEAPDCLQIMQ